MALLVIVITSCITLAGNFRFTEPCSRYVGQVLMIHIFIPLSRTRFSCSHFSSSMSNADTCLHNWSASFLKPTEVTKGSNSSKMFSVPITIAILAESSNAVSNKASRAICYSKITITFPMSCSRLYLILNKLFINISFYDCSSKVSLLRVAPHLFSQLTLLYYTKRIIAQRTEYYCKHPLFYFASTPFWWSPRISPFRSGPMLLSTPMSENIYHLSRKDNDHRLGRSLCYRFRMSLRLVSGATMW